MIAALCGKKTTTKSDNSLPGKAAQTETPRQAGAFWEITRRFEA
jgi:hypothetical protein